MKVPASQCYLNSFTIDTVLRLAFTLNEKETKERIRRTLCGLLACFGVFMLQRKLDMRRGKGAQGDVWPRAPHAGPSGSWEGVWGAEERMVRRTRKCSFRVLSQMRSTLSFHLNEPLSVMTCRCNGMCL